jgi:glutaredoxin
MARKRRVEVFNTGCVICEETVAMVRRIACGSCEVEVHDMRDAAVAARAKSLGVRTAPAVVIDGGLAACCTGAGPEESELRAAGIGTPLP